MVNFMLQLDRAGCADYTLSLGVSVRGYSDEAIIWIGGFTKADCPPQWGDVSSNSLMAWRELKAEVGRIYSFHTCLSELGHWPPPAVRRIYTISSPGCNWCIYWVYVSTVHFYCWIISPQYGRAMVCLTIHSLRNTWVVSTLGLVWIKLL